MSLLDKYAIFHGKGTKLMPFQAHAGMAFFFTTIAAHLTAISLLFWLVVPAMLAVIAGKEYMDMKTSTLPYSYFDLGSWAVGAAMAAVLHLFT